MATNWRICEILLFYNSMKSSFDEVKIFVIALPQLPTLYISSTATFSMTYPLIIDYFVVFQAFNDWQPCWQQSASGVGRLPVPGSSFQLDEADDRSIRLLEFSLAVVIMLCKQVGIIKVYIRVLIEAGYYSALPFRAMPRVPTHFLVAVEQLENLS